MSVPTFFKRKQEHKNNNVRMTTNSTNSIWKPYINKWPPGDESVEREPRVHSRSALTPIEAMVVDHQYLPKLENLLHVLVEMQKQQDSLSARVPLPLPSLAADSVSPRRPMPRGAKVSCGRLPVPRVDLLSIDLL